MSKATHTSGPWAAFYKHKYNEWHVSVPLPNSDMRLSIFPDGIPGDTPEEAEGNARLIAAAPDLLAACEQMYRAMMAMGNDLNWDMSDYGYAPPECPQMFPASFVEAMNAGKVAIAAAKGE